MVSLSNHEVRAPRPLMSQSAEQAPFTPSSREGDHAKRGGWGRPTHRAHQPRWHPPPCATHLPNLITERSHGRPESPVGNPSTANIGLTNHPRHPRRRIPRSSPSPPATLRAPRGAGSPRPPRQSPRPWQLRGAPRRSEDRRRLQPAAQPPARADDPRRRQSRQARPMRKTHRDERRRGRPAS